MPFDPSKPFEEVSVSASGFDPNAPFDEVVEQPSVKTKQTYFSMKSQPPQGAVTPAMTKEDDAAFSQTKVGDYVDLPTWGRVRKVDDYDFVGETPDIPVASGNLEAGGRSFVHSLPGGAAGAAAFGAAQTQPFVQRLQQSPNVLGRGAGMALPLVAGVAGAMGVGTAHQKGLEVLSPEVAAQLQRDQETNPNAVAAGAALSDIAFFRPDLSIGRNLAQEAAKRAIPATIAGGLAAVPELQSENGLDSEAAKRIAMAGLGGAAFGAPNALGAQAMNIGEAIGNQGKRLVAKMGKASTKNSLQENQAAVNDIAINGGAPSAEERIDIRKLMIPPQGIPTNEGTVAALTDRVAAAGLTEPKPNDDAFLRALPARDRSAVEAARKASEVEKPRKENRTSVNELDETYAQPKESEPLKPTESREEIERLIREEAEIAAQERERVAFEAGRRAAKEAEEKLKADAEFQKWKADAQKGRENLQKFTEEDAFDSGRQEARFAEEEAAFNAEIAKRQPAKEPAKIEPVKSVEQPAKLAPKKAVPESEFVGIQEDGQGGGFELWNVPEDIPGGTVKGSTVTRETLEKAGYEVPKATPELIASTKARREALMKGFDPKPEPTPTPEPQNPVKAMESPLPAKPEPVVKKTIAGHTPQDVETTASVVVNKKKETIFKSKKDGNWYDSEGNVLSGGSRQVAIDKMKAREGMPTLAPAPKAPEGKLPEPIVDPKPEAPKVEPKKEARKDLLKERAKAIKDKTKSEETPDFPLSPSAEGSPAPYVDQKGRYVKLEGGKATIVGTGGKPEFSKGGVEATPDPIEPNERGSIDFRDDKQLLSELNRMRKDAGLKEITMEEFRSSQEEMKAKAKKARGVSEGKTTSESGAAINPIEPMAKAAGKAVNKLNEWMVKENAPKSPESKPAAWKSYVEGAEPPTQAAEPPAKPEGRDPTGFAAEVNRKVRAANEALKKKQPPTREQIWEMVKNASDDSGIPTGPKAADIINDGPEEALQPLSDIAANSPYFLKEADDRNEVMGGISKLYKKVLGTVIGNVRQHLPELVGAIRTKVAEQNAMRIDFTTRADQLGKLARKSLTREEFNQLDAANLSGDRMRAEAVINGSKTTPQQKKDMLAAYDMHQQVMSEIRDQLIAMGREVGEIGNYFPRQLIDRKGLREAMGKDGWSTYEDLVRKHEATSEEDKDKVLNNLILGSMRNAGQPGYLNKRSVDTISNNLLKFYEPFDVATHNHIMRTTRDISNRKWFGKVDGTELTVKDEGGVRLDKDVESSSFGKIIRNGIEDGKLTTRGFDEVIEAMGAYFQHTAKYDQELTKVANGLRKLQTYAYLADFGSAVIQLSEVAQIAQKYGWINAIKSVGPGLKRKGIDGESKFDISQIGLYEPNQDLVGLGGRATGPASSVVRGVEKIYSKSMKQLIQRVDDYMTGSTAHAAFKWVNETVKDQNSEAFKSLDRQYSEMFPERWPEILKDLKSDDFKNGKLNANTKFFLMNEVANIKPIDASERAQGYNASGPWGKLLYTLRTYPIKQLDTIRRDVYENLKAGRTREGLANLATYIFYVAVGQQAMNYGRDLMFDREVDPMEYAVTGVLQTMMIPRYAIFRAQKEGVGEAVLSTAIPGFGLINDTQKDVQLAADWMTGRRYDGDGSKVVRDFEDFYKQSRFVQYLPVVGRSLYWHTGRGNEQEKKREMDRLEGKPEKSSIEGIGNMFIRDNFKGSRDDR